MMNNEERQMEMEFFPKKLAYMELFKNKKENEAWQLCRDVWDIFPEPKYEQPLFYLLVEDIVKYSIETKCYDIGNKYVAMLFITGLTRVDSGDKEFLAGKLAYAQGEFKMAKQYFQIAYKKSAGRLLKGKENTEYKKLIKE